MLLLAETSFKGLKVHMDRTHNHSYLMEIGKVFTHLGPGSHVVQALGAQESENGIKAILKCFTFTRKLIFNYLIV